MAVSPSLEQQLADDYFTTPDGRTHLSNIGIRLRDVAAFLAEHGLTEAADHVAQAYGCILGNLAAQDQNN